MKKIDKLYLKIVMTIGLLIPTSLNVHAQSSNPFDKFKVSTGIDFVDKLIAFATLAAGAYLAYFNISSIIAIISILNKKNSETEDEHIDIRSKKKLKDLFIWLAVGDSLGGIVFFFLSQF